MSNQYPQARHASPQAWRRLRNAMSYNEMGDIARDIANVLKVEMGDEGDKYTLDAAIEFALNDYEWEGKAQL